MTSPQRSSAVEEELRAVLKPRRLPSGVAEAIADAPDHTRGAPRAKHDQAQRRDAVQRLVKAGQTLQIAMRRADAAYQGVPSGRHFVSHSWRVARSTARSHVRHPPGLVDPARAGDQATGQSPREPPRSAPHG